MLKGVTSTGFVFAVTDEALDDYELLEKIEQITNGDGFAIVGLPKILLGEQEKALKDHVRQTDGRVTTSGMMREIFEILNFNDEIKK